MELRDALSQIAEIRGHLARSEVFRGFRSLPVAFSGLAASLGALLQAQLIDQPLSQIGSYVTLWVTTAAISLAATAIEIIWRARRMQLDLFHATTKSTIENFLPCVIAGGLLTAVLARDTADGARLLPGLWQVLYSLGIFACCRQLPAGVFWLGAFYLFTGIGTIALAHGDWALSPWAMGLPFGIGQTVMAAVLYWSLERVHETE